MVVADSTAATVEIQQHTDLQQNLHSLQASQPIKRQQDGFDVPLGEAALLMLATGRLRNPNNLAERQYLRLRAC